MVRTILATAAALALALAAPASACPNCNDCPMHKGDVAAADKGDKSDPGKKATCACAGEGKQCTCGAQCQCPHCTAKKAEKKDAKKS